TIPQQSENIDVAIVNWLSFSTPIKTTIDLCGHTIKTTSDTCVRFNAHKIDITFKNGNLNVYNITFADINDGNGTPSKITFDGITAEQPETTTTATVLSPLFNISCGGTLVLTGGSVAKSTDLTAGMTVKLEDSTLVLLGGKVEGTVSMSSPNNTTTAALLDEWNGITATGANRIGSISATMGDKNYILFGGDSTAENVEANFAETDEESNLRLAQSAAISGEAEEAGKFASINSTNRITLITSQYDDKPDGFAVMEEPDTRYFKLPEDSDYHWMPNNVWGQDEPLKSYSPWSA
ncbi:MAG: hypothetical protein II921_02695, partial [Treponema sp.]|nr:hypothetical protein [Treponema sp.]